jgi:hypothetical protein
MGAISSITDTFYALRFLRILTMPWEKTGAFKVGLIDENGKLIKKPESREEKTSYTLFHRLVYNIRRTFNGLPGPLSRKIANYATALFLIREHYELSDAFAEEVDKRLNLARRGNIEVVLENVLHENQIPVATCLGVSVTSVMANNMLEDIGAGTNTTTSLAPDFHKRIAVVKQKTFRKLRTGRNKNWQNCIADEEDRCNVTKALEEHTDGILIQCDESGAVIMVRNKLQ